MADGGFLQIIGQGGHMLTPEEGQLSLIVSGIEDGSMPVEPMYSVGATLATRIATVRPASQPVQRFNALAMNPNVLARMRAAVPMVPPAPYHPPAPAPGPTVAASAPGSMREVVQGLDTGTVLVAAGATFAITFNASMLFRPTRLMIGPSVAPLWVVEDIKVAADSLFLQTGAVPAEVYLPDGVGASALKRRTAQPGTPVQVIVTNIDGAAHRFRGALFGDAADASSCA